ncbi:hypothetical protein GCM10027082_02500 [Comamonas humi]
MTTTPTTASPGQQLLAQAQQLLADGDPAGASPLLLQARAEKDTMLAAHALIERHDLSGSFRNIMGLDCTISPADDIFGFFVGHPSSVNPLRDYLADGWRTLAELMAVMERVGQPLVQSRAFLEFASGHGRFTRHLVKLLGADKVTVSDVVPDAVDFAARTFGVQGFLSASVPEALAAPRQYDTVFVLSLFSHLPRGTWARWLQALYDTVAPGGMLVFSTHGIKAAQFHHVPLDAEGFFFAPSSESHAIDPNEYGTAFTTEAFVRARIAETVGADRLEYFAPVQFWNHQDVYVLRKKT